LLTSQTMTMEWLGLGITPATYDDGFNSREDRPDFFGDERTRQAIALCLDRQKVVDTVLFGLSQVPNSYIPSDHPLYNSNIQTYEFNPTAGIQLLEQAGSIMITIPLRRATQFGSRTFASTSLLCSITSQLLPPSVIKLWIYLLNLL